MKECANALIEYFKDELPKLQETYQWKIPNIEGFHMCGEKGYAPNVELKKYFNKQWLKATADERYELSKTVVADWGGVRNNNMAVSMHEFPCNYWEDIQRIKSLDNSSANIIINEGIRLVVKEKLQQLSTLRKNRNSLQNMVSG